MLAEREKGIRLSEDGCPTDAVDNDVNNLEPAFGCHTFTHPIRVLLSAGGLLSAESGGAGDLSTIET